MLDQDLGLQLCVEHLSVQELIPQLAVEALHVSVLPRGPRLNVERLQPDTREPLPHTFGSELAAVTTTGMK